MGKKTISNVSEYINKVLGEFYKSRSQNKEYNFFNKNIFWYRGQNTDIDKLDPSIFRDKIYKNENILHKEIIMKLAIDIRDHKSELETNSLMQHYGMPTRLLDWTLNPLIALYFATLPSENEKNGKVFILDTNKIKDNKYFKRVDDEEDKMLQNILLESRLGKKYFVGKFKELYKKIDSKVPKIIESTLFCQVASFLQAGDKKSDLKDLKKSCCDKIIEKLEFLKFDIENELKISQDEEKFVNNYNYMIIRIIGSAYMKNIITEIVGKIFSDAQSGKLSLKSLKNSIDNNKSEQKKIIKIFEKLKEDICKIIYVFPPILNDRIERQSGVFTVHGGFFDSSKKEEMPEYKKILVYEDFYKELDKLKAISQIEVGVEYKMKIQTELDILGINEAAIFPDIEKRIDYIKKAKLYDKNNNEKIK